MPKTHYEDLPLLPHLIAERVCATTYTGQELSNPSSYDVVKVEAARQQMTGAQVAEFADLCDAKCRLAYDNDLDWMLKCARAKDNSGRDQLYIWITHWLASYLKNPTAMRRHNPTTVV